MKVIFAPRFAFHGGVIGGASLPMPGFVQRVLNPPNASGAPASSTVR